MKKINCPLCHSVGVIFFHEPKKKTNIRPVHTPGGETHVGNYSIDFEGGGYDFSHAETCEKITKAFDKKSLLESYIDHPSMAKADRHSFEDYKNLFRIARIALKMEILRKEESWQYLCFLISEIRPSDSKYNKAFAKSPDEAFSLLKHRLLCGELIHVTNPPLQMVLGTMLSLKSV
ncbi:MAG: hypothetical protein KBC11_02105 [Candidatus Pacebacteria bacterium]|nr:hypothetical protein [Candidatus Paceibacterota bacterium]